MADTPHVVNVADAPEVADDVERGCWGAPYKPLTPALAGTGRLGMNLTRVPPGRSACPFHTHQIEDEVFFVLSGRGVLRYGDALREVGPGDCITCPAASGIAHQLANPFEEDFVYLAIGGNSGHEVCTYPDSGKVNVRSLKTVGRLSRTDYWDGEPDVPAVFALARAARG